MADSLDAFPLDPTEWKLDDGMSAISVLLIVLAAVAMLVCCCWLLLGWRARRGQLCALESVQLPGYFMRERHGCMTLQLHERTSHDKEGFREVR